MKRMACVLNNDARIVNAVQTRCIASSPYFPPYLTDKTTSVASGIPSPAQPYYLIYYITTDRLKNQG